jgi:hypothetical protein
MIIQGVQQYQACSTNTRSLKKQTAGINVIKDIRKDDSYKAEKPIERKSYLDAIKKKIKSGYYNSEEVAEDLSQSFAQVFDSTL